MVWQKGKHVVLNVIAHVPIEVPVYHIHVDRTAVKAMVKDILGQSRVLRQSIRDRKPRPEQVGEANQEQGKNAVAVYGERDHSSVDGDINTRAEKNLVKLRERDEGFLIWGDPAECVQ